MSSCQDILSRAQRQHHSFLVPFYEQEDITYPLFYVAPRTAREHCPRCIVADILSALPLVDTSADSVVLQQLPS